MKYIHNIVLMAFVALAVFACDNGESVDPDSADVFVKYYGGEGVHEGVDVEWVSDGYILVGNGRSTEGNWGLYLVRTDFFGNQVENPVTYFPEDTTMNLLAVDAVINQSGNLIVASKLINPENGNVCIHLVEFANGTTLANDVVFPPEGTAGSFNYTPESITVLGNGDIVVTGSTDQVDPNKSGAVADDSDFISLKFTPEFELYPESSWRRYYGQSGPDYGHKVIEPNDGLIFFGSGQYIEPENGRLGQNLFTFLGQGNGFITSSFNVFGTTGADLGGDIARTYDGGFVVLGNTDIENPSDLEKQKPIIIRMNASNDVGASGIIDKPEITATNILESNRGGYVLTGNWSDGSDAAVYVAFINSNFEITWENRFGIGDLNEGHSLVETPEGSVLILGTINLESQTKMSLIKINPDGQLIP